MRCCARTGTAAGTGREGIVGLGGAALNACIRDALGFLQLFSAGFDFELTR